jgi:hypothetical protein
LKNGKPVPYIPVTITTSREAYAASLPVLFKHVADFHICVVRVFSAKYGIPEDDILKTIQESDEFKNMHVDPVIDTDNIDSLGYLAEVPVPKEEVPTEPEVTEPEVATAPVTEVSVPSRPTKVKKVKNAEPEPAPVDAIVLTTMEERESDTSVINTKTMRKKMVAPNAIDPTPTPVVVVVAEPVTLPEPIKTKTIRKKIVPKPTQPIDEPVKAASSVPAPATTAMTAAPATTAMTAAPATSGDAPRKIIKKKAKPVE